MDFTQVIAGADDDGRRLDRVMRRYLSSASLSALYKSLRSGLIKVNGKKCDGAYHIHAGDTLTIATLLLQPAPKAVDSASAPVAQKAAVPRSGHATLPPPPAVSSAASAASVAPAELAASLPRDWVLFRSKDLLVLNKPYDIPVQPTANKALLALSTLVARDYAFFHRGEASLSFHAAPLHRLDRKTTGVLVCSQSLSGAHWFTEALQRGLVEKHYVALVCGTLTAQQHWHDDISRQRDAKRAFHTVAVRPHAHADDGAAGKPALTDAVPLAHGTYNGKPITLVQLIIHTGRMHQIRSQAASHGFPLLGDTAYGSPALATASLFLHAYELRLSPAALTSRAAIGDERLPPYFRAPLPAAFTKSLAASLINWDGRLIL